MIPPLEALPIPQWFLLFSSSFSSWIYRLADQNHHALTPHHRWFHLHHCPHLHYRNLHRCSTQYPHYHLAHHQVLLVPPHPHRCRHRQFHHLHHLLLVRQESILG